MKAGLSRAKRTCIRPTPLSLNAYSNRSGPTGDAAETPNPYPYPCPGFPRVPPGSPNTLAPDFRSLPTSKNAYPFSVSVASGTESSAEPTMNFLPVPTPPSGYPRTLLAPPMEKASYGGKSPMTLPPFAATKKRVPAT
eukprot:31400-Pelagococcus_subviridis.AAC.6